MSEGKRSDHDRELLTALLEKLRVEGLGWIGTAMSSLTAIEAAMTILADRKAPPAKAAELQDQVRQIAARLLQMAPDEQTLKAWEQLLANIRLPE